MKIIHFFPDDKFAKYIFKQFEVFKIQNEYCVFSEGENLKYVDFQVRRITKNLINYDLIDYINSFDSLFIHYLGPESQKILSFDTLAVKIFWIGWGGDYYWLINDISNFELFKPLTYRERLKFPYFSLSNLIFKKLKKVYHSPKRKLLKKIDFFSPVLKLEYDIIKNNYDFRFQYFDWNYGNLEHDLIIDNQSLDENSDNILIGNSATYPNNFFDLFHELKPLNLEQKIYCPLTYGDNRLKEEIIKIGNLSFAQFEPIINHRDYSEYILILRNCRNVIMGHMRQQALGTILAILYQGSNVFFYEESILFKYFNDLGIKVFSIDILIKDKNLLNNKISEESLIETRSILVRHWGEKINSYNTHILFKLLESQSFRKKQH